MRARGQDALHKLLSEHVEARLDPKIFVEPNVFRNRFTYIEEADAALARTHH